MSAGAVTGRDPRDAYIRRVKERWQARAPSRFGRISLGLYVFEHDARQALTAFLEEGAIPRKCLRLVEQKYRIQIRPYGTRWMITASRGRCGVYGTPRDCLAAFLWGMLKCESPACTKATSSRSSGLTPNSTDEKLWQQETLFVCFETA